MPELDGVAVLPGQLSQEFLEPRRILPKHRGQLPEDWSEMLLQRRNSFEEDRNRLRFHVQLLHLRNESAPFYRVKKIVRRRIMPGAHARLGWQTIERRVDFNCVELAGVELE